MFLILIFGVSSSFASADVEDVQTNDTDIISVNDDSHGDDVLSQGEKVDNLSADSAGGDVLAVSGTFDDLNTIISTEDNVELNMDYSRSGFTDDGIIIDRPMTIDGKNHKLDAQGSGKIFRVTSTSNIVFKNLNFVNANDSAVTFSGAISNLEFINCNFTNNSGASGGAIFFTNTVTNVNMTDLNFINNSASSKGGSILFNKAVNEISMKCLSFLNSHADGMGGAINFNSGYSGNLSFDRMNFTNCTSKSTGGAINFESSSLIQNLSVTNSNFIRNNGTRGGAIRCVSPINNLNIYNVNFTSNTAFGSDQGEGGAIIFDGTVSNFNITDIVAKYNNAYDDGGAFNFKGDCVNGYCNNILAINNTAYPHSEVGGSTGGSYGAVFIFEKNIANFVLNNSMLINNSAKHGGGVLHCSASSITGALIFDNLKLISNSAGTMGGFIAIESNYNIIINNTEVINSSAGTVSSASGGFIYLRDACSGLYITNVNLTNTKASSSGGAIYVGNTLSNMHIDNVNFINTTSRGSGGVINLAGVVKDSTITNTNFFNSNNTASSAYGGVIYTGNTVTNMDITDTKFINTYSMSTGGVIYYSGKISNVLYSNLTVDNVNSRGSGGFIWVNNEADNMKLNNVEASNISVQISATSGGGFIYSKGITNSIINNLTTNNVSTLKGSGGLFFFEGAVKNMTIFDINVTNTEAGSNGGIISMNSLDIGNFNNWILRDISAGGNGGIIYVSGSVNKLDVTDIDFADVATTGSGGIFYFGSTISDFNLNNVTFINISSKSHGGVFYFSKDYADYNLKNLTFINCYSKKGHGGVFYYAEGFTNHDLTNFTFINCSSGGSGGAIYINGEFKNGDIYNLTFNNVHAGGSGGLIYAGAITNSTIYTFPVANAYAGQSGGVFYIHGAVSKLTLGDFEFINNSAGTSGGAIFIGTSATNLNLYNLTFLNTSAKTARGGAIFIGRSITNMTLLDSKFTNCSAGTSGGALTLAETDTNSKLKNVRFNNLTFINVTSGQWGGVIYSIATGDNFNLTNITAINTYAKEYGGVFQMDRLSNANFINWNVTNSSSGIIGGVFGIWHSLTNANFINVTVRDSYSNTGGVFNIRAYSDPLSRNIVFNHWDVTNSATKSGSGGVFYFQGAATDIIWDDISVIKSTAQSGDGGVLHINGLATGIVINNTNVTNSNCTGDGGAFNFENLDSAIITNVNFNNTHSNGHGGAIRSGTSGSSVTNNLLIDNVNFINSTSNNYGGAMCLSGDLRKFNLTNCNFNHTSCSQYGGAVFAGDSSSGYILFSNLNFTDTHSSNVGGAIAMKGTMNKITLNNIFAFNTSSVNRGGFLYQEGSFKNMNFTASRFYNSSSTSLDGGVMHVGGNIENADIYNCIITNVSAESHGSAFNIGGTATNVTIYEINFSNTHAIKESGTIRFGGVVNNLDITHVNFTNTSCGVSGSAIHFSSSATNFNLTECIFIDATANVNGGVICTVDLTDCNFHDLIIINSTAKTSSGTKCGGGAFFFYGALKRVYIHDINVTNVSSALNGGVIYAKSIDTCNITDLNIINHSAEGSGGVIYVESSVNNFNVTRINFTNSHAGVSGGVIYTGAITDSNFYGFSVTNASAGKNGGVFNFEGKVTRVNIYDFDFIDNTAETGSGGAIYVGGGMEELRLHDVTFTNDYAGVSGGAIYINSAVNNFELTNIPFINCTAETGHGGVIHTGSITDSKFHNLTVDNATAGQNGGAFGFIGATTRVYVYNINFTNVNATGSGGIIAANSIDTCNFTDLNIINTGAGLNGGIFYVSGAVNKFNVTDIHFTNSHAGGSGGFIYVGGTITDAKFYDFPLSNSSAGVNGGVFDFEGVATRVNITGFDFFNSSAGAKGGVFYFGNTFTGLILEDVSFVNSSAGTEGGVFFFNKEFSNYVFKDMTFINSSAGTTGGVFYVNGAISNVNFKDMVIVNSSANTAGVLRTAGITDCSFDNVAVNNSRAKSGEAGAFYFGAATRVNIYNSDFNWVNATSHGGVIRATSYDTCNFYNLTFNNHYSGAYGGVIYASGAASKVNMDNISFNNSRSNDGSRGGGVMYFDSSSNLNINNVNFTNNYAKTHGGVLYVYRNVDNAKFTNLRFINNSAGNSGGTIFINGYSGSTNTILFANLTFINNSAVSTGGSIYLPGVSNVNFKDIVVVNSTANAAGVLRTAGITDCSFDNVAVNNSRAKSGEAGAFYFGAATRVNIYNSDFNWVNATSHGGVIRATSYDTCNFYNLTFNNHYSGAYGGVIYASGAASNVNMDNISVNNSRSTNTGRGGGVMYFDSVTNLDITNSNFTNNHAKGSGGILYVYRNVAGLKFANLNIINNSADSNGGVIYVNTYTGSHSNLNFINLNVTNCTTKGTCGGIYFTGSTSKATFDNVNFTDTYTTSTSTAGGVIRINGVSGGSGNGITINNTVFNNYKAGTEGAAVYLGSAGDLYMNNISFSNKVMPKTKGSGGIVYAGSATSVTVTNVNFTSSEVSTNKKYGGAMYVGAVTQDVVVENVTFVNNKLTGTNNAGGALYISSVGNDLYMTNVNFTNSEITASNGIAGALYVGSVGNDVFITHVNFTEFKVTGATSKAGAFYLGASNHVNLVDVDFINSKQIQVKGEGGALYLTGASTSCNLDDVRFINTSSTSFGGAIYNDYSGEFNINNSSFENCTSTNNGGAIYVSRAIIGSLINNTNFTKTSGANGGALFFAGAAKYVEINNLIFNRCSAVTNGGAVFFTAVIDSKIVNSTFANGTSKYGGALYTTGNNIQIFDSKFINNIVTENGGAINWAGESGKAVNCEFINNTANSYSGCGGAIYVNSNARYLNISLSNFTGNKAADGGALYILAKETYIGECNFTKNYASRNGGAIYLSTENAKILNSEFNENTADGDGGAIYLSGKYNTISNSTFTRNRAADGGGIYDVNNVKREETNYIFNSTFRQNVAVEDGGGLYLYTGVEPSKYHFVDWNDFDHNADRDSLTGRLTWSQGLGYYYFKDCLFEDNIDYLILVKAIDSGSSAGVIEITLPRGVNKGYKPETGAVLIVNLNNGKGYDENITVTLIKDGDAMLTTDPLPVGDYNVTVLFYDNNHLFKSNVTELTVHNHKGDFEYLQELINNATRDHVPVLQLNRSFKFSMGLDYSQINITADYPFKIVGNGLITIDALNQCRIFFVNSSDVTIENIRFINGDPYGPNGTDYKEGGAIFWAGANGSVINSEFRNNNGSYGGGIYYNSSASNSKIANCMFIENNAAFNGGAIDCNATRMNLTNTEFDSNRGQYGAALCREANANGGYGFNNTFRNNYAYKSGPALGWINSSSIKIDTYFFYNNTAVESGGAIYVGNGSQECKIFNCVFESNKVLNETGNGGAIDWHAKGGQVENSSFTDNHAFKGGAIYIDSVADNITIINTDFTRNDANDDGGAIYLLASTATLNLTNFYDNTAENNGGALYVGGQGKTNYIYSSTFTGNKANNGIGGAIDWLADSAVIKDTHLTSNCAMYGGGIYFGGNANESRIDNCIFTDNHAKYNGGAIDCNSSAMYLTNTTFDNNLGQYGAALCREVNAKGGHGENNIFKNNHAYISGAALGWMGSENITIIKYTFINNSADVSGGAIYVSPDSHNCSIINSTFENNYVSNKTDNVGSTFDWTAWNGDNMYYAVRTPTDSSLIGQTVQYPHFTVYYYNDTSSLEGVLGIGGAVNILAANATIVNSNFTDGAARLGGGIYVGSNSGRTNIVNSIFKANKADEKGGAVILLASAVHIEDSKFYDNEAVDGAALYVGGVGTENSIHKAIFDGNKATGYGAGIYWVAYAGVMDDINFTENSAEYGGGIYFNGKSGNTNLTNVLFKSNSAVKNGGAIECNASNIGIYNITFESNYAGEYGAALCREDGATNGHGINNTFIKNHAGISGAALAWMGVDNINITRYNFTDNTAGVSGAAIYVSPDSDNCIISFCRFEGNEILNATGGHGGAIDIEGNNASISDSDFIENHAFYGGAIFAGENSGNTNITNVKFIKNSATVDGGAFYVAGIATTNGVYYSEFINNTAGGNGGAINWISSVSEIFYSNFTGNTATYGGGLYLSGNSSNSNLSNIIFKENRATKNGGAIDCNASMMGLSNTTFTSNYAGEYGAALCREAGANGGFGGDNNFTKNHADIAGAALAWLGVENININRYIFINNTAGEKGGAIYVREDSPNCKVRSSYFDNNHITDVQVGQGGAIAWFGTNGYIYNTTFENSFAVNGGTLYVGNISDNMTIVESNFISSMATGEGGSIVLYGDNAVINKSNFMYSLALIRGGTIAAHEAYNATIVDCTFIKGVGAGYVDKTNRSYGDGGAIFWENANNINISNSLFQNIEAHALGAVAMINCNDSVIYNSTFNGQFALDVGGSIAWINSDNIAIDLCNFSSSGAAFNGGSIFLNNTNGVIKNSNFNNTSTPWGNGGAIYVSGNVTIDNSTFIDCRASSDNAAGIYFNDGVSTLSNSSFDSPNTIWVGKDANVTISENNITGRNSNRDLIYLEKDYDAALNPVYYSVWNDGNMTLKGNDFNYVIFNNGTIWSKTYVNMLSNKTYNITWMDEFTYFAEILDDTQKNHIISVDSLYATNDVYGSAGGKSFPMKYNRVYIPQNYYQGAFHLMPHDSKLIGHEYKNGTVNVKMPLILELKYELKGDNIVVTAKITPDSNGVYSNFTLVDKLVFIFKGNNYQRDIFVNGTQDGQFYRWIIANATYEMFNNLAAGHYTISAYYPGDDCHLYVENSTDFDIQKRITWINMTITNGTWAYYPIANISTNGNGTVVISMHGRNEEFKLYEADGNYTNKDGYNYTMKNGVLIIPFDTVYDPGKHVMGVTYLGDDYYEYALNETTFEVYYKNTSISANSSDILFWDVEVINVTLDVNATGYVRVIINNTGVIEEYMAEIINGTGIAQFRIANLFGGNYTNVEIIYEGDPHFNGNTTYVNFTVNPTPYFDMDVKVDNIEYGENATVRVLLPTLAYGNVTIYVDGVNRGTVNVTNGVAVLGNISGLAGGTHYVNVTYNGGINYAAKNFTDVSFNVTQNDHWKMNLTVDAHTYGENTTFTVRLPEEVSKNVTLEIDGLYNYTIVLTKGVGNYTLNNLSGGFHTAIAYYEGDLNYTAQTVEKSFIVGQLAPYIIIINGVENTTYVAGTSFTINVTTNSTAKINITLNGKVVSITDNNTNVSLGALEAGHYIVRAVVFENENYTYAETAIEFTVEKNNATLIIVGVENGTVHNVSEVFRVNVTTNSTGVLNLTVDGVVYPVVNNTWITIGNLAAGHHIITAVVYENENYTMAHYSVEFDVVKYNATVEINGVENKTYMAGNSFVINATTNSTAKINITVNGKSYIVDSDENIALGALVEGHYIVTAVVYENENYTMATQTVEFDVKKYNATVIINGVENATYVAGTSFVINATTNSTGLINISLNGVVISVVANNTNIDLGALEAGHYIVTAFVKANHNYTSAVDSVEFTVVKNNATVVINGVTNTTYVAGTSFVINATTNSTGLINITVNGKSYVVANNTNIDLGALEAGHYIVTAVVYENHNYTMAAQTIEFTVVKYNATVVINGVTNATYVAGTSFVINATTNSTGLINISLNGVVISVVANNTNIGLGALEAGHYVVTAFVKANHNYTSAVGSVEFTVVKNNATVVINGVTNATYVAGTSFVINATTNSTGLINISLNGVVISVVANNTNIDLGALEAGHYVVTAFVKANHNYTSAVGSVEFTVVKNNATVVINGVTNATYVAGTSFVINATTNSSGLINISLNGVVISVVANNTNIGLGALEAGHYVVTAFVKANHNYTSAVGSVEFTVVKNNATVVINGVTNTTYAAGTSFVINATTNSTSLINITVNGKSYVVANDTNIDLGALVEGHYIVTAVVYENHNYTMAAQTIEFTVVKYNATVVINGVENATYAAGTSFVINATTNSTSLINITVNGKVYTVANDTNIDLGALEAGHYIITAIVDANDNYTKATQTVEFTVIKYNATVEIEGIENGTTHNAGPEFTVTVKTNSSALINVTLNGKPFAVVANGTTVDFGKLGEGHYVVTAFVKSNHNYTAAFKTIEFDVIRHNATVVINGVENTTYYAGTSFTINATTNSTSLINITVNGKSYVVENNENIVLGQLDEGHYIVTAVVKSNDNYTFAIASVEFTVVKYNAAVVIDGVVDGSVHNVSESIVVTVVTNSTGVINLTVDGVEWSGVVQNNTPITIGNLAYGHHIITAVVYENHNYTMASNSVKFTVERFNATAVINGVENKTYMAGTSFTINVTTNSTSLINVSVNGKSYVVRSGENIDLGALEAGHYIVSAVVKSNENYTLAIASVEFTVEKYNATVVIDGVVDGRVYNVAESFVVTVITNSTGVINLTVDGVEWSGVVQNNTPINIGNLAYGHHIITAVVKPNDNYTLAITSVEFNVVKFNTTVDIVGIENGTTYNVGPEFEVTVTTNSSALINVTLNGKQVAVVANGTAVNFGKLGEGHYVVTAFVRSNQNYTTGFKTIEFDVIKFNATVVINGVENTTYYAGTSFVINATTNSTSLINITVNGKSYVVENNVNIDLGALEAGHYIITAVVKPNENYTLAMASVEFTVVKYNAAVVIDGIVDGSIHNAGESYVVTVITNSTGVINLTVDGVEWSGVKNNTAIPIGILADGHHIITAVVYENENYTMASCSVEFTVEKYNATVVINGVENKTYMAGTSFTINATTNSTGLINITVNGKSYVVENNVNIDLGALEAGHYIITAIVDANDNYTKATQTVEFTVIKYNATVVINGVENETYAAGTSFTINATTNSSSMINISVNGKVYTVASGENIELGALDVGHYVITAFVKANHNYTMAIQSVEFTVVKYKATVVINGVENKTYMAGTSFAINATTNSSSLINISVNGKVYTVENNENINLGALEAGHYIITAFVKANHNYTSAIASVEFTVEKYNATVVINGVENTTYYAGTEFTINATTNSTALINIYVNGKVYTVESNENIVLGQLDEGHYVIAAVVDANDNYTKATQTIEFTVIKYNATVVINGVENKTYMAGTSFVINAITNSTGLINITVNGKSYVVESNANIDLGALEAGHYIITAFVKANHNYTSAIASVEFTVEKYNATVVINGVENTTYYAGTEFTINATTNSTGLINIYVNGKVYTVESNENIVLGQLDEGHYVIAAVVDANDNYTKATQTIEFTVIKYNATVVINGVENKTYEAGTSFTINATTNSTGLINITVNGKSYVVESNVNIDLGALEAGHYIITAFVKANHNYTSAIASVEFTVEKFNATVDITGVENITYNAGSEFEVVVTTNSSSLINVSLNGVAVELVNNGSSVKFGDLAEGHYVVTAFVGENHNYTMATKSIEFTVIKYNATVEINGVENRTYEAGTSFIISAVTNSTGLINITVNGKTYTVASGENINLGQLDAGHYTVTAFVKANHNYTMAKQTVEFTVIKYNATVAINGVENTTYYAGNEFTINATTNSTSMIEIYVNGKSYTVENNANIDLGALAAGHYIVTAVVKANHNYTMASQTVEFTVVKNPAPMTINVTDVKAGDVQIINVTVPDAAKGFVHLDVDGKHYYANVTAGVAQFEVRVNKAGEYVAVATYLGDDIYLENSTSTSFNVSKVDHEIEVEIGDAVAGGDMVVRVTVPEDANGTVAIMIDNETVVNQTVKGGENTIVISNMTEGDHNVSVVYSGDDKYESKTVNKTIVVTSSVIAQDKLTRGINSLYDYEAEFLDKDGNVLADTEVQFVIDGKTYTVKTDMKGTAKLNTSHLGLGTYNVTSINPVTGQQVTKELTIVKRLLENKDITMDFVDGTKYKVKVIGDDGNIAPAGEFIRAYINKVYYPLKVTNDGYAYLPIKLNPGKYTITVVYKGYTVKNSLKVRQTLKLVKKTVKVKKGKKIVLKAKLKWSNGKPIKGKKIVFKLKGKKFAAKTNKKGIAKVTIKKKKVLKKLKKGKKYEFTAKYITNTVKGKVKVKK